MDRPTKFEEHQYIGDRRTQVVYDVDALTDAGILEELLAADRVPGLSGPAYTCFSPDTLAEARNRGYKLYRGAGAGIEQPDADVDGAE